MVRSTGRTPPKTLSPREIKELLDRGAKPGDHTSVPDDEARCLEAVRRAFSLAEPPRAELWLLRAGRAVVVETAPEIARLKLDPADG